MAFPSSIVLQTRAALGEVDILVNNAGIAKVQDWQDIMPEDWGVVLAANLTSSFLMSLAVLPASSRQLPADREVTLYAIAQHSLRPCIAI
ncbi:SDR family NAD(P)-dependent oxidoreductase [Sodalis sp. dw_96]|uniref:SDR family NAD(P)-dependent oxidoreductase n=1 Tax=Sodalis sp. dw_96 TaxID=2719794 RepID=UPI001BD31BD8|nr:SDR family NAD(P)-dependent oxidoreductase [Sodalis sp. dw_96]